MGITGNAITISTKEIAPPTIPDSNQPTITPVSHRHIATAIPIKPPMRRT
jgi:hypothetical protein